MSTHNTREKEPNFGFEPRYPNGLPDREGIEERVYELLEKHVHAEPDGENIKHEFHPLRREIHEDMVALLHQELQKAREEERERIENELNKHIAPHGLSLEDSVWLKRLLNKVFGHEN